MMTESAKVFTLDIKSKADISFIFANFKEILWWNALKWIDILFSVEMAGLILASNRKFLYE